MSEFKRIGECTGSKIDDKTRVTVYTTRSKFLELKKIAIENDTSVSEMLRVMIENFLNERKTEVA